MRVRARQKLAPHFTSTTPDGSPAICSGVRHSSSHSHQGKRSSGLTRVNNYNRCTNEELRGSSQGTTHWPHRRSETTACLAHPSGNSEAGNRCQARPPSANDPTPSTLAQYKQEQQQPESFSGRLVNPLGERSMFGWQREGCSRRAMVTAAKPKNRYLFKRHSSNFLPRLIDKGLSIGVL